MAIRVNTKTLDRIRPKAVNLSSLPVGSPLIGTGVDVAGSRGSTLDLLQAYARRLKAADARTVRESNVWIARSIEYLKGRVAGEEHSVRIRDSEEIDDAMRDELRGIQDRIEQLLEHPNQTLTNDSFGAVFGAATEDTLTINRGCIQKLLNEPVEMTDLDGSRITIEEPYALKPLDGATVTFNPKWTPDNREPRYFIDNGTKTPTPLRNEELIVMDGSPTTYSDEGIAPMKVLRRFIDAELATFRRMHLVQIQSTPGGVFILPNAAPGTADALKDEYETSVQGSAGVVFMAIPEGARFIEIGSADMEKQGSFRFYEIIVRGCATAFGIPPMILGWYADVNKAYGEVAQDLAFDGVIMALKLIRWYVQTEIVAAFGPLAARFIYFTFDALEVEEEKEEAQSLRTKAGDKDFILISELRTAGGYEEIDEDEIPAGAVPFLKELYVPTLVGNTVIKLPWSYWFKFMKVDPDTMELLTPEPPPPPPGEKPPKLVAEQPPPGSPAANANGNTPPENLPPGTVPPETANLVQKQLSLARKAMETQKDPDGALAILDGVNSLIERHLEDWIPEPEAEIA